MLDNIKFRLNRNIFYHKKEMFLVIEDLLAIFHLRSKKSPLTKFQRRT